MQHGIRKRNCCPSSAPDNSISKVISESNRYWKNHITQRWSKKYLQNTKQININHSSTVDQNAMLHSKHWRFRLQKRRRTWKTMSSPYWILNFISVSNTISSWISIETLKKWYNIMDLYGIRASTIKDYEYTTGLLTNIIKDYEDRSSDCYVLHII